MTKSSEILKILIRIKTKPNISQRELAKKLGFSIGKINYCVKDLKRKGLIDVQVNPDCVKFIKLNSDKTMDWYCYDLPSEAQVFIEDYDEEDDIGDLEPFDFELTKLNHKERVEVIDNVIQEVKGYENKSKV